MTGGRRDSAGCRSPNECGGSLRAKNSPNRDKGPCESVALFNVRRDTGRILSCMKSRGGRPSKYAEWLQEENLMRVESWAASGCTNDEIAKNIGVSRSTFFGWVDRFQDFSDALKRGRSKRAECIESRLHDVAMGYCTDETEVVEERFRFVDGEMVPCERIVKTTKRKVPPSVPAIIFEAKNRCGYADNPSQATAEARDAEVQEFIAGLGLK